MRLFLLITLGLTLLWSSLPALAQSSTLKSFTDLKDRGRLPALVTDTQFQGPIAVDKLLPGGFSFHPKVQIKNGELTTELLSGDPKSRLKLIYAPILFHTPQNTSHIIYGGWESSTNFPADELFMIDVPSDINLLNLGQTTAQYNRRRILTTSHNSDPTVYHINDPSLVQVAGCHYRLYFEFETINQDIRVGNITDPKLFQKSTPSQKGYTNMNIAYADSFNCGQTWNAGKPVTRSNGINIQGLTSQDYFNYQLGWPAVLKSGNEYIMYFTADACPRRQEALVYSFKELVDGGRWDLCVNDGQSVANNPNFRFGNHTILYATSRDGLNFTYQGQLKGPWGTVWGLDDVKPIAGSDKWLVVGPGATVHYHAKSHNQFDPSTNFPVDPWGKYIGYIDPKQPGRIHYFGGANADWDTRTLMARPSPLNHAYEPISVRIATRPNGELMGFLYGEWNQSNHTHGYIGASLLQKKVLLIGRENNTGPEITVGFTTALNFGETLLSFGNDDLSKNYPWVALKNSSGFNPIYGRLEVYSPTGTLLCTQRNIVVKPGDILSANCGLPANPAQPQPVPTPVPPVGAPPESSVPTAPQVTFPANGQAISSNNPTFTWSQGDNLKEIWVDLVEADSKGNPSACFWNKAADALGAKQIAWNQGQGWGTRFCNHTPAPSQLVPNKKYFLRVVGFDQSFKRYEMPPTAFTYTLSAPNPTPLPSIPSAQVTFPSKQIQILEDLDPSVLLNWTSSHDVDAFWIDLTPDSTFTHNNFWNTHIPRSANGRYQLPISKANWNHSALHGAPPSKLTPGKTYRLRIVPFKGKVNLGATQGLYAEMLLKVK